MRILVIAEHDNRILSAATLHALGAACALGGEIDVLVAGDACAALADTASRVQGVGRVLLAEAPHYADGGAENVAALIVAHAAAYSHVVAAATAWGKHVMPRVAALLDVAQVSDVVGIVSEDTFVSPIYAGSVMATLQSCDACKVLTIRPTAFDAVDLQGGAGVVDLLPAAPDTGLSHLIRRDLARSSRPDLGAATVVVAGGRGLVNAENYALLLEPLADKLGAALGASRAAVDAGFVPNDYQIGQTGKVIAPQLYIAVGISGAMQHLAGIQGSRVIVAINKDPDAAIFQVADYYLLADLFDVVPQLTAAL